MPRAVLIEFFALAAIWGSSFLFTRLAVVEFGPWPTAAVRVAVAVAVLLPLLLWQRQWADLRQHWRRVLFVGVLNSGIPFACFAYAVLHISTGLSAILNATVPLCGALVAWIWLGDRPTRSRALGLAIGFAGVALLAWEKASFKPGGTGWAVVACLVACVCYGVAASFTKRHLNQVPSLTLATGSQIGATLALCIPAALTWPAQAPGAQATGALVVLGVLCTGFAYLLYFRLIARAGPARALTVTFLIPVFAVVYGMLLLGESVSSWMLLCGVVIVAGTALSAGLVQLPGRQRAG